MERWKVCLLISNLSHSFSIHWLNVIRFQRFNIKFIVEMHQELIQVDLISLYESQLDVKFFSISCSRNVDTSGWGLTWIRKYSLSLFLAAQLVRRQGTSVATRASPSDLFIPPARTFAYRKSVLVSSTRLWNSLPPSMRDLPSIATFNRSPYEFLRTPL